MGIRTGGSSILVGHSGPFEKAPATVGPTTLLLGKYGTPCKEKHWKSK